jgi:hypothetical protein
MIASPIAWLILGEVVNSMKQMTLAATFCLVAVPAFAQGWYNPEIPAGPDSVNAYSRPVSSTYNGLFTGPGGELYSGTVNTYSMNLGNGISMSMFSSTATGPAGTVSGFAGGPFVPGFAATIPTNYADGLYLNPALSGPSSVAGRMSMDLGHGFSLDFLGGVSRGQGGYYPGPGYGLDSRMSTTFGTGFSMDFGHGGRLSIIGSMSQGSGPAASCGYLYLACR